MNYSKLLKDLIKAESTLVMPDAYDVISAKLIEKAGFLAIQCSGYCISLSKGISDEKSLGIDDNVQVTESIVNAVSVPVMADGEDGYGGSESIATNIARFIDSGAAGINIEDQSFEKNSPQRIVSAEEMTRKISIAIETIRSSRNCDFLLNARTDSLLLDDRKQAQRVTIDRANRYLEAGADICFVCYVRTLKEVKLFSREINGPISIAAGQPYNVDNFSITDCMEAGVARVSLPTFVLLSNVDTVYSHLNQW